MGRIIFWLALVGVGYAGWRAWAQHNRKAEDTNAEKSAQVPKQPRAAENQAEGEKMLACAHCKVFAPISDMIVQNGAAYCSHEHARIGA